MVRQLQNERFVIGNNLSVLMVPVKGSVPAGLDDADNTA